VNKYKKRSVIMGKLRAIIPIVLAIMVAAGGSTYIYRWTKKQGATKTVVKVVKEEAVPVAVAALKLPWGTKLKPEMMKSTPYLTKSLPQGYTSDQNSLIGRVLITNVEPNEPILESKLASAGSSGGVSALLKPGKRAVAVKGSKIIGISGFIKPGHRVDVLVTMKPGHRVDVLVTMKNPFGKGTMTKTVLENLLVLATGTMMSENEQGKPSPVDVYSLEVDPSEAEKLGLAATKGKLQFTLRSEIDHETVLTRGATERKTLASFRPPLPPRVRKNKAAVQTIKGGKVKQVKF
jgi:pilus assembly protein CpaB